MNQITQLANDKIELEIGSSKQSNLSKETTKNRTTHCDSKNACKYLNLNNRFKVTTDANTTTANHANLRTKKALVIRQRCQTMQSSDIDVIKRIGSMLSSIYISYDIKTVSGIESKWFLGFYYVNVKN